MYDAAEFDNPWDNACYEIDKHKKHLYTAHNEADTNDDTQWEVEKITLHCFWPSPDGTLFESLSEISRSLHCLFAVDLQLVPRCHKPKTRRDQRPWTMGQRHATRGLKRGQVTCAVPDSAGTYGGICKHARSPGKRCRNGKKRLQAGRNGKPLHDPWLSCTTLFLAGVGPRPMALRPLL